MKLSIIIPVYNEAGTVKQCLKRVLKIKMPEGVRREIVVVDDGSENGSKLKIKNIMRRLGDKTENFKFISYPENRGKGYAVRQGLKQAKGDYVLIQDADLEYDPEDYHKLLKPVLKKKAKVVYGSRFLGPHKNMFFWNMVANHLLSLVTNILYNTTLSDMEVGYKIFPKKLILGLGLREDRFGFEPEVTAKVLKKGIRIYEVPISYSGREYHEGKKIGWRDGVRALWVLLKYRITS